MTYNYACRQYCDHMLQDSFIPQKTGITSMLYLNRATGSVWQCNPKIKHKLFTNIDIGLMIYLSSWLFYLFTVSYFCLHLFMFIWNVKVEKYKSYTHKCQKFSIIFKPFLTTKAENITWISPTCVKGPEFPLSLSEASPKALAQSHSP